MQQFPPKFLLKTYKDTHGMLLNADSVYSHQSPIASMLMFPPSPKPPHHLSPKPSTKCDAEETPVRSLDDLLVEVEDLFECQLRIDSLLSMSKKLQSQLQERLESSSQSMLPSHNYTLPTGQERGVYLAVEIGGSTLRIALVDLGSRGADQERLHVRRMECSPIDTTVRELEGLKFFDWMAGKIRDTLAEDKRSDDHVLLDEPLRMGIAWSFPLDQTSIRSGNVLGMGKGFRCSKEVLAHDLGEIIEKACQRANLNIRLDAIVNDSSATLLSQAYVDSTTSLAVILGTGINAAVYLPISALHKAKFGSRIMPAATKTTHVLVNTEFSMFGKGIFPTNRWDEKLNISHKLPNYQPLEYLIAGGYMGEIVRLIMIEATATAGLFGGSLPKSLSSPYSLDTRTLASIEMDTSNSLSSSIELLQERHPSPCSLTYSEIYFIRQIIRSVSRRSSGFFTAGVHALSSLLNDLNGSEALDGSSDHASIGCDGSVINKYPGYMDRSQETMDKMISMEANGRPRVILKKTIDSTVLGAGVAGAMAGIPANL